MEIVCARGKVIPGQMQARAFLQAGATTDDELTCVSKGFDSSRKGDMCVVTAIGQLLKVRRPMSLAQPE